MLIANTVVVVAMVGYPSSGVTVLDPRDDSVGSH